MSENGCLPASRAGLISVAAEFNVVFGNVKFPMLAIVCNSRPANMIQPLFALLFAMKYQGPRWSMPKIGAGIMREFTPSLLSDNADFGRDYGKA